MKNTRKGTIRGYFRSGLDNGDLKKGIAKLLKAGVSSGNLFFEKSGTRELERMLGLLRQGDSVLVLRVRDICGDPEELCGIADRLISQGVVLRSLGEPWFRVRVGMEHEPVPGELLKRLYGRPDSWIIQEPESQACETLRSVGRPSGVRPDVRLKLDSALALYKERKELSVAEICGSVGLNERTFYRFLDRQGSGVVRRPKGRKSKRDTGKR